MTQSEVKELDGKSTVAMQFLCPGVPHFYPFHCTISRFQDTAHFRILSLNPISKFHKCGEIVKAWPIAKKSNSLYSLMASIVFINLDWDWVKTVGGIVFLKRADKDQR